MKFSIRGASEQAYGRLVYRFRWLILVGWTLIFLAGVPLASMVSSALTNSGYETNSSQSHEVDAFLSSALRYPTTQVLIVFHSNTLLLSDPIYQHDLQAFETRASRLAQVSGITAEGAGQDGRTTVVVLGFNQDANAVASHFVDVRAYASHANLKMPSRSHPVDRKERGTSTC